MTNNRLRALEALGQSVWLDNEAYESVAIADIQAAGVCSACTSAAM